MVSQLERGWTRLKERTIVMKFPIRKKGIKVIQNEAKGFCCKFLGMSAGFWC